jgi:hypothetical protein
MVTWIVKTFGKKEVDRAYIGHGNFKEKRVWRLRVLGKVFTVDYDLDYY